MAAILTEDSNHEPGSALQGLTRSDEERKPQLTVVQRLDWGHHDPPSYWFLGPDLYFKGRKRFSSSSVTSAATPDSH